MYVLVAIFGDFSATFWRQKEKVFLKSNVRDTGWTNLDSVSNQGPGANAKTCLAEAATDQKIMTLIASDLQLLRYFVFLFCLPPINFNGLAAKACNARCIPTYVLAIKQSSHNDCLSFKF
jgi:hypothetical protein